MINPLLKRWEYTYDARNRKLQEFAPSVPVAVASGSTVYDTPVQTWEYDDAGRVTGVTDPLGQATNTVYDNVEARGQALLLHI